MSLLSNLIANHKGKIISIVLLSGIAIASIYFFGPDNPVEQGAEKVIEAETGFDIDFSPEKK